MVGVIDDYLISQMCHSCHNKMVPHKGDSCEKYCIHCGCDVDRDVDAAKNSLEVLLFRMWMARGISVVHIPQTAEVQHAGFCRVTVVTVLAYFSFVLLSALSCVSSYMQCMA
jgi:hypothetical protein